MADPIQNPSDDPAKGMIFAYAAPVTVRANGAGSDDLLAIAKDRALDPDALDEYAPFFFRVIPSTNALDSYFTSMAASSLKNYAADFENGRAFQDSHRHDEQPLGQSLTGKYVGTQGNGIARIESDFFISRGVSPSGDSTIARIRTGTTRDVSIGFYGGQWTCSICGRDMLADWDCWHIPGMSYSADEKDMDFFCANETARAPKKKADTPPERILCTASIENAHAAECSGVFDGATPGAVIKAQRMADGGRLAPAAARFLESQFHVRIFGADQTWRGWTPSNATIAPSEQRTTSPKEGIEMTFEEEVRQALDINQDIDALEVIRSQRERVVAYDLAIRNTRAVVTTLGAPADADPTAWSRSEIERLRPLADDGSRYRDDLIEDAIKSGVRSDETFPIETFKGILARSSIDEIKVMRGNWEKKGSQNFQPGRQSGDDDSGAAPVNLSDRRKPSKRAVARV